MPSTAFDALLADFAEHVGLSAQELAYSSEIVIDTTTVTLFHEAADGRPDDGGDVVMFCTLNMPPVADRSELYKSALEANMLWVGTGGATLGLQPGTGAFTLCAKSPVAMLDADELARALDHFVDAAECWSDFVRARHVQPSPAYEGAIFHFKV